LLDPADSQEAAAFQFFCGSFWSHVLLYATAPGYRHYFSESQ
jgi:hypothetical protein